MFAGSVLAATLGLCSLAAGTNVPRQYNYPTHNKPSNTDTSTTPSPSSASQSGLTGGTVCTSLMCIGGVVNGSTVQYTMQSKGNSPLGWMAMGFGQQMANSPMVIMWSNNGDILLSQRQASGEVPPDVVSNPANVATADTTSSSLSGDQPKLSFTMPFDGNTNQRLIWAFSRVNPGSSSSSAPIVQHDDSGPTSLDLSQALANPAVALNPAADPTTAQTGIVSAPLLPFQKKLVAHGILCTIGFLIFLPFGALLARYARVFTSAWFAGHWVLQFALAGVAIVAGVALGLSATSDAGAPHQGSDHKRFGVALFALYLLQLALGAVIHWAKPRSWRVQKKRPAQNYVHAVLGLLIIGLAFYQVRTGFREEWDRFSGRAPISNAANIVWYVWVVLVPVLYFAGLAFLRRQFRQERPAKQMSPDQSEMRRASSS